MSFEYFIAKRYLRAKRKTGFISIITYVSIVGITIGVTALILVLAVMNGLEDEVRGRILGAQAHIHLRRYFAEPITESDTLLQYVRGIPHVVGATPAIFDEGMIKSKSKQYPTEIKAVDPASVNTVLSMSDKMILGSADFGKREINGKKLSGIVLGKYLADAIHATNIGDIVTIWTMPKEGGVFTVPTPMQFYVAGLVEFGYYEIDKIFSYISLKDGQKLFKLGNSVSKIEIKLDDYTLAKKISNRIKEELGYPYTTITWYEMNRSLFSWMEIEKWGAFIILSLIIMVAAFNIVSSLIMVVMEKTKEIGILISMGATSKTILKIFLFEGLLVGLIGTVLGNILGYSIGFLQLKYHIIALPPDVYIINFLPILMKWTDFVYISGVAIFLSLAASAYPAYKASKLEPVEAIRYE
jgi:lipoprotein-releasing system permease protein